MMDEAKQRSALPVGCVYVYMGVVVLHCSRKCVPALVTSNPDCCYIVETQDIEAEKLCT